MQTYLATFRQQLELDQYGILYQRCPHKHKLLIYVPEYTHETIMREWHFIPIGSHISPAKTLERLCKHFFWSCMAADAHHYCNTCVICAARKGQKRLIRPFLRPIPSPSSSMEVVSLDILTLERTEVGNKKALVSIDLNSKFLFFLNRCHAKQWQH